MHCTIGILFVGAAELSSAWQSVLVGTSRGALDLNRVTDDWGFLFLSLVTALGNGSIILWLQELLFERFGEANRNRGKRLQNCALYGNLGVLVAFSHVCFLNALLRKEIGCPPVINGIDTGVSTESLVECYGDGIVVNVLRNNLDGGKQIDRREFCNSNCLDDLDIAGALGGDKEVVFLRFLASCINRCKRVLGW